jgi:lipopolysaccharide/colanic/teichoic acid biosynthesis glycosyltransferase
MIKRLFDVIFALFWLRLTAPLIVIIAILIKFDSPGPIFYIPQMIGKNGKSFRMIRFRTMHVDKPASTTSKHTRVGRFIRNYSLDHLPTLFNVLSGDITIVGPRPMEPEVVDLQNSTWQRYFQVKPGFFNYSVLKLARAFTPSHANNMALIQELELEYIEKQSLMFDVQLFLKFLQTHIISRGNVKARGEPDPKIKDWLN